MAPLWPLYRSSLALIISSTTPSPMYCSSKSRVVVMRRSPWDNALSQGTSTEGSKRPFSHILVTISSM